MYRSLHNIALVCEIVTSNEIHNFITGNLQKLPCYFTLLLFCYCNLLQLQVTEKVTCYRFSLLVTSYYPTLLMDWKMKIKY